MAATAEATMATKRKPGRPATGTDYTTVKCDRKLAHKLKLIATERGEAVAEVLTEAVGDWVEKEFARILRAADVATPKPTKGGRN